jgi:hypothetical protein
LHGRNAILQQLGVADLESGVFNHAKSLTKLDGL